MHTMREKEQQIDVSTGMPREWIRLVRAFLRGGTRMSMWRQEDGGGRLRRKV